MLTFQVISYCFLTLYDSSGQGKRDRRRVTVTSHKSWDWWAVHDVTPPPPQYALITQAWTHESETTGKLSRNKSVYKLILHIVHHLKHRDITDTTNWDRFWPNCEYIDFLAYCDIYSMAMNGSPKLNGCHLDIMFIRKNVY